MPEINLSLKLSVAQLNLALTGLAQLPYGQVCTLIDKLRQQAEQQIAEAQQPKTGDTTAAEVEGA